MTKSDLISQKFDEMERQIRDLEEKRLVKTCEEHDFIVGSMEVYEKLREYLPKDAKILFTRNIDPSIVLLVKKIALSDEFLYGKGQEWTGSTN